VSVRVSNPVAAYNLFVFRKCLTMSEGRHHLFHHKKEEDDDNVNSGYAYQRSYGSSDNQPGSGFRVSNPIAAYNMFVFSKCLTMSEGRHHILHNKKEEGDDNINWGYVNQGSYGSSVNQPGSGYNAGSDYQTGSGYNAGSDYQTGSGYNADSDYQRGSRVNVDSGYGADTGYQQDQSEDYDRARQEVKGDKRKEHLGEFGAMAAGGYALYEKHESKKDPEHAGRHKIEEEVAAAAAVGGGGYAFHEHHEKKQDEETAEEAEGGRKQRHHLF